MQTKQGTRSRCSWNFREIDQSIMKTDQRTFFRRAGDSLRVGVVYEDKATHVRALHTYDYLLAHAGSEIEFQFSWWSFDLLREARRAEGAARIAEAAELVIFSTWPGGNYRPRSQPGSNRGSHAGRAGRRHCGAFLSTAGRTAGPAGDGLICKTWRKRQAWIFLLTRLNLCSRHTSPSWTSSCITPRHWGYCIKTHLTGQTLHPTGRQRLTRSTGCCEP